MVSHKYICKSDKIHLIQKATIIWLHYSVPHVNLFQNSNVIEHYRGGGTHVTLGGEGGEGAHLCMVVAWLLYLVMEYLCI